MNIMGSIAIKGSEASENAFIIQDLTSYPSKDREGLVDKVTKIERKTFPSSEAFDFKSELKKKNTTMLLVFSNSDPTAVVGYLVFLRMKRLALLHKICVVQSMRGKGIGKRLVCSLREMLEKGGCQTIQLWVDEVRQPARALYQACGFEQMDRCEDYYGPGRTGLKMQLSIEE